jgi:uncharacterized protein (DUF983 family)
MRAVPGAPRPADLLRRALRLRCPACGRGRVFARGFRRAPDCGSCGRRLDRDEGHWLGGAEIHMVLTFGASAAVALPLVLLTDLPGPAYDALALAHLLGSLALYRHSRSLFLAMDYALDPTGDAPPGPRPGPEPPGEPVPVPAPGSGGIPRRRRRPAEERFDARLRPVGGRPASGPVEAPVLAGAGAEVE